MEESLSKFMAESTKIHDENSNLIKEIQAATDAAIQNQGASIKALEIQIEQMGKVIQERSSGSLPSSTKTNPRDHVKSISTTLRRNQVEDLRPMIEGGEVIDKPMVDIIETRNDDGKSKEINKVVEAWILTVIKRWEMSLLENHFVEKSVSRQGGSMELLPFTMVSAQDKLNGISHPYQKLKSFYKGVLNLGPEYIRDAKIEKWLTRGHVSTHEME
ncbi:hypothetical protein Tco_0280270 [Tanacetum coccineum]